MAEKSIRVCRLSVRLGVSSVRRGRNGRLPPPYRVRAKAEWFQEYWNRTVARADGFAPIVADPVLVEADGPRTTIVRRMMA